MSSTLLAIDQAYDFCSMAVQCGDLYATKTFVFEKNNLTRGLTTSFIASIQSLCNQCHTQISDIKRIAATVGPASFTGLRVVLASLQGIAFANQAKVFTCTRLELDAYRAFQESPDLHRYTSHLSNQRGEFFTQSFVREEDFPQPMDAVTVTQPTNDTEEVQDTAQYLLDWAKKNSFNRVGGYDSLVPFYGHTPEFKKKF